MHSPKFSPASIEKKPETVRAGATIYSLQHGSRYRQSHSFDRNALTQSLDMSRVRLLTVLAVLLLSVLSSAQYSPQELEGYYGLVEPTNRTQNNYNSFSLTVEGNYVSNIQALTVETDKLAGLNSAAAVSGNLRMISGNYTGPALDWSNAALIDCDNATDVVDALNEVLINNPACTILYSLKSDACHFTRPYRVFSADVGFLFTTVSAGGAQTLLEKVQQSPVLLHSVAWLNTTSLPEDDTPVVDDKGPSKDTKIAMAVLYCICGVLALAVVVLISLGIWRVHRHPERYGLAPPQQTDEERQISDDFNNGGGDVYTPPPTRVEKAKGLARAVLDAIPLMRVMKKSDEKGDGETAGSPTAASTTPSTAVSSAVASSSASMYKPEASPSSSSVKSSCDMSRMETLPVYIQQDDNCAICFDNFEDNQIIRQLPCTHRFHADCVDHWLLNSSSQCPMCRMNLTKEGGENNGDGQGTAEAASATTEQTTPTTTSTQPTTTTPTATPSVITVTQRDLNISLATRIIDWWNMLCLPEDARAEARDRLNHESELRRKIRLLQRSDGTLMPNDGIVATDDGALRVLLDNRPLQAPPIDVPLSERMLVPGPDLDLNDVDAPVPRYSVVPEYHSGNGNGDCYSHSHSNSHSNSHSHSHRDIDNDDNDESQVEPVYPSQSQTCLLPHLDLSEFTVDVDDYGRPETAVDGDHHHKDKAVVTDVTDTDTDDAGDVTHDYAGDVTHVEDCEHPSSSFPPYHEFDFESTSKPTPI